MTKTTLLINTIGPDARIALLNEGGVVAERAWLADRELSRRLLEEIDALIVEAGLDKKDIRRVAVHGGPGHFGSTRTGVVAASALAYAFGAELAEVAGKDWIENVLEAVRAGVVDVVKIKYDK